MKNRNVWVNINFGYLMLATIGWLLLLLFVGTIVQLTNAGVGCPAWFLCYEQAGPPSGVAGWLELVHYAGAGIAALLAIAVAMFAWRSYRHTWLMPGLVSGLAATALLLLAVLSTVWFSSNLWARIGYQLAVFACLSIYLVLATLVWSTARFTPNSTFSHKSHKSHFFLLLLAGAALLLLLVSGTVVTETGSGSACPDWPLCRSEIFPSAAGPAVVINLVHRFAVVFVGILIAAVVLQSYRHYARQPALIKGSTILGLLFLAQIAVGGWTVLMPLPRPLIIATHLVLMAAIWGSLIVLTTRFRLMAGVLPAAVEAEKLVSPLPPRRRVAVYFKLTKPWIMVLLLITTIGAMFIAAKGLPPLPLLFYTAMGGMLAAGGASVLNSYVDSDIDQLMSRTSRRATVTGLVTAQETLLLGLTLSTLSFFVYAIFVNTLSAALSTLGILYYVFFYTLYLKRATIHNIIIGGAAGAIPPLVGWTAVTGRLDLGAFYLFAIIFFWTPPHTWALALLVKKDYARARVPMLPVVVGEKETTYQIFLYAILLITLTLLPVTFNMLSLVYFVIAIALGLPFLYLAWKLWRDYNKRYSKQLYKFSQLYLALLFLVMAVDRSFFV